MAESARKRRAGVTLIELVLVMSTVAILVSLSSMYIREIVNLWNFVSFRNDVVSQGRMSMMRMVREMRQVNNVSAVLYSGPSRFRFIDTGNTTIEYSLSGAKLMRNANAMAGGVNNLSFVYYGNQSQELVSPKVSPQKTDITSIAVNMTLASGAQKKNFNTRVYPRNLAQ